METNPVADEREVPIEMGVAQPAAPEVGVQARVHAEEPEVPKRNEVVHRAQLRVREPPDRVVSLEERVPLPRPERRQYR